MSSRSPEAAIPDGTGALAALPLDALLALTAAGNQLAFADLYDRTAPRVHSLCRRLTRNDSDAEEATQDTYLEIWSTAARFDSSRGSAISWILMLAHSRAVTTIRKSESTRRRDTDYAAEMAGFDVDVVVDHILRSADVEQIRLALPGLSAVRREAVTLAFYSGHTYAEASKILQVPLPTFKTRVRDGLLALRGRLV